MYINEQTRMILNGTPQFVSIRAERENAPLLLYLHGGPGDAALPLVLKFNKALESHFTVVVWEQRGAGKSYYKFDNPDAITIDLFVSDLLQLVQTLLRRFHQEKLFLVGHSWGSVLGLRFVRQYPDLVQTYVGCGQVVNMKKSCQSAYAFALAGADKKTAEKLKKIDCTYSGETWLNDLLYVTKCVVKYKGSLYGETSYRKLVTPFLFSGQYTLPDLIKRQKGGMQAIRCLWQELMLTDFEPQTHFDAPVIFVEGAHDQHVSSALAKQYFDTIQTEKQFYWFDQSCHFPQWSENDRFNQLMIDLL